MGLTDIIFGKDPKDSLPPWLKNWTPPPGYMDYLQTGYMPGQSSSSSSQTNSRSNTKSLSNTMFANQPYITQDYAPLATLQRDSIFSRLAGGGLPQGFLQEGLRNIGQAGRINESGLRDKLIQAGLGDRTAAGMDMLAANQADTQASFLNTLPTIARENQAQDLGLAQAAIGQFGTGQMGSSTTKSNSTTNSQSNTNSNSSSSGGIDYGGMNQLVSSLMPYYTAGRQGGLLSYLPSIAGLIGSWFGGGSKSPSNGGGNVYTPYGPGYGG